jgi:hypothetical protein
MPSKLKKWIEDHPAAVLVGLVISSGSVASSVTAYLSSQLFESKISEEKSKEIAERSEIQNKYNDRISDLTGRLSSIERRIGDDRDKKYFDIQAMQVSAPEVKNLPDQFRNYDNGSFFLDIPISDTWKYQLTTEGDVTKLGPFRSFVEQAEQTLGDKAKEIFGLPAHVWTAPPVAEVSY